MTVEIKSAIEDFWLARGRAEYFPAAYEDRLSLDEAYRIQLALIDRRVAAGERHIGWKVGLTAKAIQQQFGFHEPVFGCILQSFPSGHELPSNLTKPGFETELCMRFARPLQGEVTPQQCPRCARRHPSLFRDHRDQRGPQPPYCLGPG